MKKIKENQKKNINKLRSNPKFSNQYSFLITSRERKMSLYRNEKKSKLILNYFQFNSHKFLTRIKIRKRNRFLKRKGKNLFSTIIPLPHKNLSKRRKKFQKMKKLMKISTVGKSVLMVWKQWANS